MNTPPTTTAQPMETVRLLQASMRCLALGVGGLVPVLGAGLALEAMRLGVRLLKRTGERWHGEPLGWLWATGAVVAPLAYRWSGLGWMVLTWLILLAVQSGWLWRRYLRGRPELFNAARRQVY